jgi:hypothetical protein
MKKDLTIASILGRYIVSPTVNEIWRSPDGWTSWERSLDGGLTWQRIS